MQIDLLNKNKSNRYFRGTPRGAGSRVFQFNDDFEELRMITHDADDFNESAEVMMENS